MTFKTTKLRDAITFALVTGATALAGTGVAVAQETTGQQATTLDRITVTGSRIRAAEGETAAPVLVIDRQQLEATGLTSVGDVLFNITASDGGALRNITTTTNGADGTQNVSLRGLGATRTLILVNGRRWLTQGNGVVDLNTIPIAVVERVEVLKDGASAIYGSDAIAGVINVITRTNFEGTEARAYLGQYAKGDGFQQAYDFTLGANTDRTNVVFSLSYTDQDPVFAGDRTISKVPVFGAGDLESGGAFGSGFPLRGTFLPCNGPFTTLPSGFQTCTPRPGGLQTKERGAPGTSLADFRPFVSFTTNNSGSSDRYNFAPVNYLLQPIERFNIYTQGSLALNDNINANAMATYVKRNSVQQLAEVPLTLNTTGTSGPQWAIPVSAANVFNPFGADLRQAGFRMQAVGPRRPEYQNDNTAVTLWLDGNFEAFGRGMFWDVGYSYLDTEFTQTGSGYINLFNLRRALGPSFRDGTGQLRCGAPGAVIAGCVPFNLFGGADLGLAAGTITQAEFDAMIRYVSYRQVSTSNNNTKDYFANLAGDIVDLPAGPLGFAVGYEHRRTAFKNTPDSLVSSGGSSDNFAEPTSGQVSSNEYYGELNIPILAEVPFFKMLEVNLAARRSEYNSQGKFGGADVFPDIGNDTSKKVSLRWQLFDDLLFRGTFSESFRAPSVTNLFQGGGESFPSAQDPCNTVRFPGLSATARARCVAAGAPAGVGVVQANSQIRSLVGGNPALTPEFGETRTLGIVYSPSWVDGLDLSLDWYKIELTDALAFRGSQSVLNLCYLDVGQIGGPTSEAQRTQFCGFVTRDGSGNILDLRQTNFNLAEGEVEGYDFTVKYRMPETRYGRFGFQWDNTYTVANTLFGTVGEYNGSPNWRLRSNLTTSWQRGDWDATWTSRYFSGLDEGCGYAGFFAAGFTPTELCNNYVLNPNGTVFSAENRLGSVTYHDLQVGWKAPWNARIAIGGRNIFGKEPPIARNSFAHSFDGAYDLPEGGFFYMQYNQKF